MLELITRHPTNPVYSTPILFVHGAWHGAWCWDEQFLPYFAAQGFTVHAMSLRGHGNSPGRERLRWTKGAEYVADVAQIVQQLPELPVIVGHSMGGYVVQKYLEQHGAKTAVLLASVPPSGVLRTTLNIMRHHPLLFAKLNLTLSLYPLVSTPALVREFFFSADFPADLVQNYYGRLQDEAYRGFLDMLVFNLPHPQKVKKIPTLVLGAQNDAIFTPAEVQATARAYHADCHIFPHMAHDMMLETNWQSVADHIIGWLKNQNGAS